MSTHAGKVFKGIGDSPDSLAELFLNSFLLVLLDCFGVFHVPRQTRILIAHLLLGEAPPVAIS